MKYIDPSYKIRGVPANPFDSVYCICLAHNAVHAAMSGRTEMVVGRWNGRFVHVPMAMAIRERSCVDTSDDLWTTLLLAYLQVTTLSTASYVLKSYFLTFFGGPFISPRRQKP